MALMLPDSNEIQQLIDVLKQIRDIQAVRLAVAQQALILQGFDHRATRFEFTATILPGGIPQKGVTAMQLTDIQSVTLSIQPVDAKGNPAPVETGSVKFVSSDPNTVTVGPDPADPTNELKAVATAVGPLTAVGSSVQVAASADADLGAGVATISGSIDFTVIASQATGLTINTGTPTP
jgi:hypothetical protein